MRLTVENEAESCILGDCICDSCIIGIWDRFGEPGIFRLSAGVWISVVDPVKVEARHSGGAGVYIQSFLLTVRPHICTSPAGQATNVPQPGFVWTAIVWRSADLVAQHRKGTLIPKSSLRRVETHQIQATSSKRHKARTYTQYVEAEQVRWEKKVIVIPVKERRAVHD